MKALMILGAIVGFVLGSAFGLAGRSSWPVTLGHSCVAALAAALLARWWSRVWLTSLRDALQERRFPSAPSAPNKSAPRV